jgi:peroxin-10
MRAKISDNFPTSHPNAVLGPNAGVIVANRPTYKPVAVLILLQALTALVQTAAEASIELGHSAQIAFFRWRRQRTRNPQLINHDQLGVCDSSEREMYLGLVEKRVPSVASTKETSQSTSKQSCSSKRRKSKENKSIHSCGICLNKRVHPAASYVCGHVFCWNCILHWVSNIRAECPLCRAQTRPQDVLPLYNYP